MIDTISKLWPVLSGVGIAIFYLVIKVYINTQISKGLRYDLEAIKKTIQCSSVKDYVQDNYLSQKTYDAIQRK
jgi:hypothetical protein